MTDALLESAIDGQPGLAALRASLAEIVGPAFRVRAVHKLTRRVYRISLATANGSLSLVAKRLAPAVAQRVELALERWLPAAELAHAGPALIGIAGDSDADLIWHLYEDLGKCTLAEAGGVPAAFERAVELVATIHARFAHDSALAEWRLRGEDHGTAFYESSVTEAIAAVEALVSRCEGRELANPVKRLRARLEDLRQEGVQTAKALQGLGGPATLLHGDLWPKNAAVRVAGQTPNVRLLDWDRVGPGSFSYDLSTLAERAPAPHSARVVPLYRQAADAHGVRLPGDSELRLLFAHAECARLASMTVWIAREAAEPHGEWALERLVEIDAWLQRAQEQCEDWS